MIYKIIQFMILYVKRCLKLSEVFTGVNGSILKWARKLYNTSVEHATLAIGVDCIQYINYENGSDYPTYAKLKESYVLHKPSAIFFPLPLP